MICSVCSVMIRLQQDHSSHICTALQRVCVCVCVCVGSVFSPHTYTPYYSLGSKSVCALPCKPMVCVCMCVCMYVCMYMEEGIGRKTRKCHKNKEVSRV